MANYSLTKNIHSLSVLAGVSYEHYQEETLMASRQDFPADSFSDLSAGATSGALYQNGSSMQEYKMFSYFGRINYTLMDRYLFEANFRADASSRFYADNRWGYFPSFSMGWRISEEPFMKSMRHIIDNLNFVFLMVLWEILIMWVIMIISKIIRGPVIILLTIHRPK